MMTVLMSSLAAAAALAQSPISTTDWDSVLDRPLVRATAIRAEEMPDLVRVAAAADDQKPKALAAEPKKAAEPPKEAKPATVEDLSKRLDAAEKKLKAADEKEAKAKEDAAKKKADDEAKKAADAEKKKADDDKKKADEAKKKEEDAKKPKKWFEKMNIRGYTQFRYNEVIGHDKAGAGPQLVGDGSVGDDRNFLIRRLRVILYGDISDHLYLYFQPDFAVTPPGSTDNTMFAQVRDIYADVYVDKEKEYRFRVGQSKVPFGWENLQSSQNRLALDRNDAINSLVRNERDLGVFFYYTPKPAQEFFKRVVDDGLKGSGNYGIFGVGVYNGQGGSLLEQNENLHVVARMTVPHVFENGQAVEASIQGVAGRYSVTSAPIRALGAGPSIRPAGTIENNGKAGIDEHRFGITGVLYPQPFGLQAEWNFGRGPGLNDAQDRVIERGLEGGFVQAMYKFDTCQHGTLFPFVKWNHFKGGYRSERNAPFVDINELEMGLEWQFTKELELTTMFTLTDRTNTGATDRAGFVNYRQFEGSLFRMQFQYNY
jgi:hypothetical protein